MVKDYRSSKANGKRILLWLLLLLLAACATAPQSPTPPPSTAATVGAVLMASEIDSANRPVTVRDRFTPADARIYAVFEILHVDPGTSLYVRWTSEALEFTEQSTPVVATQSYDNVFLEFHLEPVQGSQLGALQAGTYQVQLFVNDQAGASTTFVVEEVATTPVVAP